MVKAVVGDEAWRSKGGRTGEGGEEGTSGLSISSTQPFNVEGRLYSQLECHSSADREKCLLFFPFCQNKMVVMAVGVGVGFCE